MTLTGTVHLNEASNNRHQFVYGTLHSKTFVGLFAKFTITNRKLTEISLVPITYNNSGKLLIESATLDSSLNRRSGRDIVEAGRTPTPIDCLTLTVTISKNGKSELTLKNLSVDLQADTYFEVLRDGDDGSKLEPEHPNFLTECIEVDKEGSPGRICPRGYSKIIL